jgi:orotate phosphoribosyltransferase
LQQEFGVPVIAIATLDDLLAYLAGKAELSERRAAVTAYRERYGAPA